MDVLGPFGPQGCGLIPDKPQVSGARHHAAMPNKRRASALGCARRKRRNGHRKERPRLDVFYGPEAGPGVVQASIEEVTAALMAHGQDLGWAAVANDVLPVIPRVRPYPPGAPDPLRTLVPPGILVGFGIDIGPAFMNVSADLLASWQISVADLTATAVANVHRRAASVRRSKIHHGEIGEYPTEWLQTDASVGSTLVLAPTELQRIFGGPRFFITPMRDLIIGFPPDVERAAAVWLYHEIADLDPNCLGPLGYRFDGTRVLPQPLESTGPSSAAPGTSAFVA